MWGCVAATLLASVFVLVSSNPQCMSDSDCDGNQCCYKQPKFLIMSRRQLPDDLINHKGICENFQPMGTRCSPFDKLNGHCSCAEGLTCRFVAAENTTQSIVRRKLYMPGPGSYRCATPEH
ncbi:uncharacterized protein LOC132555780 [Ylistrum balloti]|uniref:uncharacterized protein LOC132555780 n=1 Tax=Ylistrum balloti TaxID=509963 RepID=UPI002905F0B0|nr:uncharacterized protein LOC132555780 [Ylistrum balloti]